MTEIQTETPPARSSVPDAGPRPSIRLDRTRPFSTLHGDRTPGDPHYRVHFFQGDLPFDASGLLVPDDNRTEPYPGLVEGVAVTFQPLYTKKRRELVEKRIARLLKGRQEAAEEELGAAPPDFTDEIEDVNLEDFLRGNAKYPFWKISKACAARFGRKHVGMRSVIEDLVFDEKIVPEDQVHPSLMRLLDTGPHA